MKTLLLLCLLGFITDIYYAATSDLELLAVVIAKDETDQLKRYKLSADSHKIKYKVAMINQPWRDGDVLDYTEGGYRVNVLKENLNEYAEQENLVVLVTDSPDAVFLESPKEIIKRFKAFQARIVFSSDTTCWPDNSLKSLYPSSGPVGNRYLNAGAFMGYAKDIVEMINHRPINDMESDQLYYTEIFVNMHLRTKWQISIDTKSSIFQNVHGTKSHTIELKSRDRNYIYNRKTTTRPIVIYRSSAVKSQSEQGRFLRTADYLTGAWLPGNKCPACKRNRIKLNEKKYPTVQLNFLIDQPTPFITEALDLIGELNYPKSKIDLFVYLHDEFHEKDVELFLSKYGDEYRSKVFITPTDNMDEVQTRHWALELFKSNKDDYFFVVESHVHLTDPNVLVDLIEQNRSIIAPLLSRHDELWSTFWGGIDADGFYERSDDYVDIINGKKRALWNVPYICGAYLINKSVLNKLQDAYTGAPGGSFEISFAQNLRDRGIFMFVTNVKSQGHLVNFELFDTSRLHNELWQIALNKHNWEQRYVHENYSKSLDPESVPETPCNDVAWFPMFTEKFCDEFIEEMENSGKWSGGKNDDPRIGYENVPTVDIHMTQVDFQDEWLYFLKVYAQPLQEKFFVGYDSEDPKALLNFIVRYRPDEQPSLRPHHDISTWTINIALNNPGIDFTGGGVRFIRQNCTITDTKKGWMLMHPGRLTHYHEGLKVKSGTRYIMVSFVDP